MKIGITTLQWANNYGAVLQAHALQHFLQTRGHDVKIIDYRPSPSQAPPLRSWLSLSPRRYLQKWENRKKYYKFKNFRKHHLNLTAPITSQNDLDLYSDRFNLLITGSDQVWNPCYLDQGNGFYDFYFLSFAGTSTKRISYSASIGHTDLTTLTDAWRNVLGKKLKAIDAISVRETSGIHLVRALSERNDAVCVADPTLLLSRDYYDQLAGGVRKKRKPYLFNCILHDEIINNRRTVNVIANQLGLRLLNCDVQRGPLHRDYALPSPEGWLRAIRDAEFVLTNSFHCMVFCLIFHVPFFVLLLSGNLASMNSRIVDLLKYLGLKNRILNPDQNRNPTVVAENIKWESIDDKLSSLRLSSLTFLMNSGIWGTIEKAPTLSPK